jgi:cell division protein FtsQ
MALRASKKKKTNRLHSDIVAQRRRIVRASVNLFVLAGVLLACGMGIAKLRDPQTLPLNSVQIRGEFRKVSEIELRKAVDTQALGGFFTTDVDAVRERVKALPWVEEVAVRRVWPDRLTVTVIEQQAVARWGAKSLLNTRGELFTPRQSTIPVGLPVLNGPQGNSLFVLQRYVEMRESLQDIGRDIRMLVLDERRAWRLELDNGLRLALGRNDRLERLQRFKKVYSRLFADKVNKIDRIDLRYANGLAVDWKDSSSNTAGLSGEKVDYVEKT